MPQRSRDRQLSAMLRRIVRAAVFATYGMARGDDDHVLSYLHWLQHYSIETGAVLEHEPLFALSGMNNWLRRVESLQVAQIVAALPWPVRIAAHALRPLYWLTQARLRARVARRVMTAARLEALYPYARNSAYDLLVRNGDLAGIARALEQLSGVRYAVSDAERALDRFMLRLIPSLSRIERGLAATHFDGNADAVIAIVLLDPTEATLFEMWAGPSLLAEGNLPKLSRRARVLLHVFAGAGCHAQLAESTVLANVRSLGQVRIDELPPELVQAATGERRAWLKATLLQQSCGLAARLDADFWMIDAAAIYSESYFSRLKEILTGDPVKIILSSGFCAERDAIASTLARRRGTEGVLGLSAGALHALGLTHLHPTSRRLLVTADQMERGRIPEPGTLMWCEDDSIVIHTMQYRPLCLRGKSLSEATALCYWDIGSPLTRNWVSGAQISASAYLVHPGDEIGFIETAAPEVSGVPMCRPGQFARLFWRSHTTDDVELLRRELRLPVDEIPSGIPRSPPSPVRAAFATLSDLVKTSGPSIPDKTLSGLTPPMTMTDIVSYADAIYRFEVESGHGPQVRAKIEQLRTRIHAGKTAYEGDIDNDHLIHLAVYLLRLGLLHELIELQARHALPLEPTISTFADFCGREFQDFTKQGEAWRARHPDEDLFVISGVVWGEQYVRNFMDFSLRSMLAPGNLPGMAQQGPCTVLITTDEAGAAAIRQHPAFVAASRHAEFRFAIVPDAMIKALVDGHLKRLFYMLYGMLDHLGIFFAQGAQAHLFMIPVDAIVADGSLVAMANYRHADFECCGGGNLVAETETFLPELARRYADAPAIAISTLELASLAVAHPHHYFLSQVICRENVDFGICARELFWPVTGGMEIHSCFIHPLFTAAAALQRYRTKHFNNVDYGMIPRMFVEPSRIKIIENTNEAYINNFASGKRRYETSGAPFTYDVFLDAHRLTYPVQKALFIHPQILPCRYEGLTPYRDLKKDVAALCRRLQPATSKVAERREASGEPARVRAEAR